MNKIKESDNQFVREVEAACHENPYVDMNLFRQWQEMTKILDSLPKEPEPKPKKVKPFRLQPIPLRMFSQ